MRTSITKSDLRRRGEERALFVSVAHCLECGRVTLAPNSDRCGCGNELYPVSKWVPVGEPLGLDDMKGG